MTVTTFRSVSKSVVDSYGHRHPGPARATTEALLTITDSDGVAGHCLAQPDQLREAVLDSHIRPTLTGQVGLTCFGVAVPYREPPRDAISCSIPVARMGPEREQQIPRILLEACARLTEDTQRLRRTVLLQSGGPGNHTRAPTG